MSGIFYTTKTWTGQCGQNLMGSATRALRSYRIKAEVQLGSASSRAKQSAFSVYLENRNRIQFVRSHFPFLLPLAAALSFCYSVEYLFVRSSANFKAALQGLFSGLSGETGVPADFKTGASRPSDLFARARRRSVARRLVDGLTWQAMVSPMNNQHRIARSIGDDRLASFADAPSANRRVPVIGKRKRAIAANVN